MIEDFNELLCENFDSRNSTSNPDFDRDSMILAIIAKVRELINKVNDLDRRVGSGE